MAFDWDEIERDFLDGSAIPLQWEVVIDAFNAVERVLGRDVVNAHRTLPGGGVFTGTVPSLNIVDLGFRLMALDGVLNTTKLISKLKLGDHSAYAELTAIYLLRKRRPDLEVELEPAVAVKERTKRPDFRIRVPGESWLFVEVTQPDVAETELELKAKCEPLFVAMSTERRFSLEVYFRCVPSVADIQSVLARVGDLIQRDDQLVENVGSIAVLRLNATPPGQFRASALSDEPTLPVMALAQGIVSDGQAQRHLVVRIAYSDDRAQALLKKEAKQLPTNAPGMVMFQMSRARGGPRVWGPLLERRLQPNINTRVSGITMFESGHEPTAAGESLIHRATLLTNQHAHHPLPHWVAESLSLFPSWETST